MKIEVRQDADNLYDSRDEMKVYGVPIVRYAGMADVKTIESSLPCGIDMW